MTKTFSVNATTLEKAFDKAFEQAESLLHDEWDEEERMYKKGATDRHVIALVRVTKDIKLHSHYDRDESMDFHFLLEPEKTS